MVITGEAKFDAGGVAENIRVLGSTDGVFESDTVPGVDGGYSITVPDVGPWYVVITRTGQVPLVHGPINAA